MEVIFNIEIRPDVSTGGSFALNRHYPFLSGVHPFSASILSKVQLQAEIKAEIDALCQSSKITAETLLEALFVAAQTQGSLPSVVAQAQERLRVRKEMGNLKSRITQLGNLLKNNGGQ